MVEIRRKRTTLFLSECYWVCMCVHQRVEREREREIWRAYRYEIFMSHVKVLKCKNLFVQTFFLLRSASGNCFTSLKSFHDFRQLCCFVSISKYDRMKYCKYGFFSQRGLTDSWLFVLSNTLIGVLLDRYLGQFQIIMLI